MQFLFTPVAEHSVMHEWGSMICCLLFLKCGEAHLPAHPASLGHAADKEKDAEARDVDDSGGWVAVGPEELKFLMVLEVCPRRGDHAVYAQGATGHVLKIGHLPAHQGQLLRKLCCKGGTDCGPQRASLLQCKATHDADEHGPEP